MKNLITKGMCIAYLSKVKESMRPVQAIEEYVDNMIQRNAKEVHINIDNDNHVIEVIGKGTDTMPFESMVEYAEKYIYHSFSEDDKYKISLKGVGSKDAAICLSNYMEKGFGRYIFMSGKPGEKVSKLEWDVCLDEDVLTKKKVDLIPNDDDLDGSLIRIENSISIHGKSINFIKSDFSKVYSALISEGLKIFVNDEELVAFDPIYTNLLGDKKDEDGLHNTMEGMVYHIIKHKTFHSNVYPSVQFNVKLTLFGCTPLAKSKGITHKLDELGTRNNGVFIKLGGRYVEYGGNVEKMLDMAGTGGGSGRHRICIDIDSLGADIFGVTSNKGNGVPPFIRNERLLFEFVDEFGNSFMDVIRELHRFGNNVYRLESLSKAKIASQNDVPFNKIKHLYDEWSKVKVLKLGSSHSEDIHDIKKTKKGKVKLCKKPSVKAIKKVSAIDITGVDTEEGLTEFIVTQSKKIEFLDNFKDGKMFTKEHLIIISNALKSNGVSPKKMQYILNDVINAAKELEKTVVLEPTYTK